MERKSDQGLSLQVESIDDPVKGARAVFSKVLPHTVFLSDMKDTFLKRVDTTTWKSVYTSRVQIPQVDGIFEDKWGKIWVICLAKQTSIFKFNNILYLEESFTSATDKSSLVFDSANPCVMDAKKENIYFPSGLSEIKVLKIRKAVSIDQSTKTAEISTVFGSLKRALIFDMQITADDKYLIVDQGSRSVRIVDVDTGKSFEQFLDASKEKMSRPLCLTDSQAVLFSGTVRSAPMISLFKLESDSLVLRSNLVFEGFKVSDGKEYVAGMVKMENIQVGIDRVSIVTTHRRIFILQIDTKNGCATVEAELDLSFKQRHKIEMGVKSLYFGGNNHTQRSQAFSKPRGLQG